MKENSESKQGLTTVFNTWQGHVSELLRGGTFQKAYPGISPPQPKFSLKKEKTNKTPRKVQHGKSLTLCVAQHQKAMLAKQELSCLPPHTMG